MGWHECIKLTADIQSRTVVRRSLADDYGVPVIFAIVNLVVRLAVFQSESELSQLPVQLLGQMAITFENNF